MKYIYLLCLFLVMSCSNQNQLSYFCEAISGDFFDYFIELDLNSNEGTMKRVLNEHGYQSKKIMDKAFNDPGLNEKYGEDYIDSLAGSFEENEDDMFIREVTDVFISFAKYEEPGEYVDIVYTLNRTNLELRELTTISDVLTSAVEMMGKEKVQYHKCEAPKV